MAPAKKIPKKVSKPADEVVTGTPVTPADSSNEVAKPEKAPEVPTAFTVVRGEIVINEYTLAANGEEYQALAAALAAKKNANPKLAGYKYTVVPSSSIKRVEVRYREKADAELHLDKQKPDSPMEDKVRVFEAIREGLTFASQKFGATTVVRNKA